MVYIRTTDQRKKKKKKSSKNGKEKRQDKKEVTKGPTSKITITQQFFYRKIKASCFT